MNKVRQADLANEEWDMTKKLAALAEIYQCAIVLGGHMNKAAGNKAAYRGMGLIDFFVVLAESRKVAVLRRRKTNRPQE